jgi:hypothetical protein
MPVRDPRILELLDRDAIDTSLATYARGIDRHDVDLINAAYFPDAQDNHGPFRDTVSNGFAEWGNALHAGKTRAHMHHLTTRWAEVKGDVAFTDTYVLFALFLKDREEVELGSGRYLDRLERRGGAWRIARRRTTIDMRLTTDARVFLSAAGGYVKGKWDRDDLSYRRPLDLTPELRAELDKKGVAPVRDDAPAAHAWEDGPPDPEARLELMIARRAVSDCIVQSLRGLDRGDVDVARSAFASDAAVVGARGVAPFEDHIQSELAGAAAEDESQARHMTTHNARVNGEEAVAETYVIDMRRRNDGRTLWMAGLRMLDRLRRKDGRWVIAERTHVADWELESASVSFNPGDGYLRSMRNAADPLQLDARDQS